MFHLVCVHPFSHPTLGNFLKGQLVTDKELVDALTKDRDHHFVRVAAPQ
jgi:hypothetical protein